MPATPTDDIYSAPAGTAVVRFGNASAPAPLTGAYRTTQPLLWVDVNRATELQLISDGEGTMPRTPARATVADPKSAFIWQKYGPTWNYVDLYSRWAWVNPGGDWLDLAGTAQGTAQPYFAFAANAAASGSAAYAVNVTAALQAVQTAGRWCAFIVQVVGGARALASQHHRQLPPPVIAVLYADGTTGTLQCRGCTRLSPGSAYSRLCFPEAELTPAALQFDRPRSAVAFAELRVTLTQHTATPSTVQGFVANPPVNAAVVQQGLAAGYAGDVGLLGAPGVLVARRYQDGSVLADWVVPADAGINVFSRNAWDPEVLGLGAADLTKLPTAATGVALANKWIYKQPITANLQLVNSSYTGDGFVPLAPGIGALRINVPGMALADGAAYGPVGSTGLDLWTLFPKALCGTDALKRTFVRFYIRIGGMAPKVISQTKMVRETGTGAEYAYQRGKFGLGVHHWTSRGGNNLVGGDGLGWTHRLGYERPPGDAALQGLAPSSHTVDNGVPDLRWGNGGGLGSGLFPNRWYCIEVETNLNTWAPSGGGPADGELRVWIDGRLASTHTGWKFRDGPPDPAGSGSDLPPFRQMGPIGMLANWYQGGRLPADEDLAMFITCDVAATSYIGPMAAAGAAAPLPTWVPAASSTVAQAVLLTVANGRLANNAASVGVGYYNNFWFRGIFDAYSGGTYNPHWGSYGAMHYYGTGHASGNENTVPTLVLGEVCTWRRLNDPSPIYGTGTDATTRGNNSFADFSGLPQIDPATCTYPVDGQVAGAHSYGNVVCLPPTGAAPNGRLFTGLVAAAARNSAVTTSAVSANRIDINASLASSAMKWVHMGVHPTLGYGPALNSAVTAPTSEVYDSPRERTLFVTRQPGPVRWYSHAIDAYVDGTGAQLNASDFPTAAWCTVHVPERDLWLVIYRKSTGALGIKWLDLAVAQPGWVNTGAIMGAAINVDLDWSSAAWCPDNSRVIVGDLQGNRAALATIQIPATLTDIWLTQQFDVVSPGTSTPVDNPNWRAAGARTLNNATDYGKWAYAPAMKGFLHFNHHYPAGGADAVCYIRPPGV